LVDNNDLTHQRLGGISYVTEACVTGDSYCGKVLNDLAGKNLAAADIITGLIKSETW